MNIDKEELDQALKFYEIDDVAYANKCYRCLEFLNNNKEFKNEADKVYSILYGDTENKIADLWKFKDIKELFGEESNPYITNILVLSGYKTHLNNMKKFNLDSEQCKIHKIRVKETLTNDIYQRNYDGIRISQMIWGAYFINLKLIEVGRLQYEKSILNPITKQKENCIKIHIPRGNSLDNQLVKKSIEESKTLIEKYFKLKDYKYYCNSWLLSKQIQELLDENSNIAKFYKMFEVTEGEECTADILNFVYNVRKCDNYNNLEENTSLQRNVKKLLKDEITIKTGIGILK